MHARTQKPLLTIGVIMTSCYSGGWTAVNPMNTTMVAAAGNQEESNSFGCSASGTYGGDVFTKNITNTACDDSPEESVVTFRDWSSRVTVDMEEMLRIGTTPRFAVRDGDTDASFKNATGVWRNRYRQTYETSQRSQPIPKIYSKKIAFSTSEQS